jgi:pimeloyl-ACP methyl ester carboxylesterase
MIITSGSAHLSADEAGPADAPPLLLLHAGVTDRRGWQRVVSALSGDRRCLSYDARGFGQTTYDVEDGWSATGDALAVLDAYGVERAIVIGSSMGGRTAVDLTLEHPDRVSALVLVAPAVRGAPNPDLTGDLAWLEEAFPAAEEAEDWEELNRLEAWTWLDGARQPEGRVSGAARELFLDMNGIALRAPEPGEPAEVADAWSRLGEITCPVLTLVGEYDFDHFRENAAEAGTRISGATFAELPGVAHLPQLEDRPELLDHLTRFLAERSAS